MPIKNTASYLLSAPGNVYNCKGFLRLRVGTDVGAGLGSFKHWLWECKMVQCAGKQRAVSCKFYRIRTQWLINFTLRYFPQNLKPHIHKQTALWMCIATLLLIAPNWKTQMSIDRKMNKQIEAYLCSGKLLNNKKEKWNILLDRIDIVLSQIAIKKLCTLWFWLKWNLL